MNDRLRASKAEFEQSALEQGRKDGAKSANDWLEYGELLSLKQLHEKIVGQSDWEYEPKDIADAIGCELDAVFGEDPDEGLIYSHSYLEGWLKAAVSVLDD
jgi:hypothetical protein